MTATVVSLDSRSGEQRKPCECPRHQLAALADRVLDRLEETEGELLITREHLAAVLDDLTDTTRRLLPPTERTAP